MVKLITTDNIEGTLKELEETNPKWILLGADKVKKVASQVLDKNESYYGKTFVLLYELVNRRFASTKLNTLVTYLVVQCRKRNQNFVIVAPSKDRVDLRLQRQIDEEVEYYK